jgi:hypothetical protein
MGVYAYNPQSHEIEAGRLKPEAIFIPTGMVKKKERTHNMKTVHIKRKY